MDLLNLHDVANPSLMRAKGGVAGKQDIIEYLTSIYGIGPVLAKRYYNAGIRTLEDIKKAPFVPKHIKLAAKYYYDLRTPIPRQESRTIISWIRGLLSNDVRHFDVIGGGSYRRGLPEGGDVDILVISDELTPASIEEKIKDNSNYKGTLGIGRFKVIALLRFGRNPVRIVEIYTAPQAERGAALMYLTGPADFSIVMRIRAKRKFGYHLNHKGLFNDDALIAGLTEKSIFKELELPYIPPARRGTQRIYDRYFKSPPGRRHAS